MSENVKPKEEWLREYPKHGTKQKYNKSFDDFVKWAKTSDIELAKEYETSDPRNFSKKWGKKIIEYYSSLIEQGYKMNYARSLTIAPRAFFKSQCCEVRIKRGGIGKAQIAMGEHEFRLEEFQRMFKVGDIEDKARLSLAISLGWGAGDFVKLEWSFLEPYLAQDLEAPVAFWYERGKTRAPSRSHLTHEAIESLRTLKSVASESQYVFTGYNGKHLTRDALNEWLKSLVKRAKIKTRGRIRFHLIRKFLFSQLSASGMNQWEAKLCVGKSVSPDILTYLKDQTQNLREKFMNAETRFTLTGYTNSNHTSISLVSEKVETLESIITKQEVALKEQATKIDVLTKGIQKQNTQIEELTEGYEKLLKAIAKEKAKRLFGEHK